METEIHARGAYGRTYTSADAVRADWKAGKDFQDAVSGRYLNIEDARTYGLSVCVRYSNDRKIVALTNN